MLQFSDIIDGSSAQVSNEHDKEKIWDMGNAYFQIFEMPKGVRETT